MIERLPVQRNELSLEHHNHLTDLSSVLRSAIPNLCRISPRLGLSGMGVFDATCFLLRELCLEPCLLFVSRVACRLRVEPFSFLFPCYSMALCSEVLHHQTRSRPIPLFDPTLLNDGSERKECSCCFRLRLSACLFPRSWNGAESFARCAALCLICLGALVCLLLRGIRSFPVGRVFVY